MTVDEAAAATRQTTEGVKSAEAILALARAHDVEMPIAGVISALLHDKVTLDEAAAALSGILAADAGSWSRGAGTGWSGPYASRFPRGVPAGTRWRPEAGRDGLMRVEAWKFAQVGGKPPVRTHARGPLRPCSGGRP